MTTTSLKTLLLTLAIGSTLVGCGTRQKDPLKNYTALRNDIPTKALVIPTANGPKAPFSIDPQDSLNFNQGEEKTIPIKVSLAFDNNAIVKYKLNLHFTGSDQKDLEAQLTQVDDENWALKVRPGTTVLGPNEDSRTIKFQISFDLLSYSSPSSKATMLSYGNNIRELSLYLYKEMDQPVIEDSDSSPIKLIPGQEVNADQDVTVQFVVAAKSLHSRDDLVINFERGPSTSTESAQLDGYPATDLIAKQGSYLGKDSAGRDRYEYSLHFSARTFADLLQKQIDSSAVLKSKFAHGELNSGDAVFKIYAENLYNHKKSEKSEKISIRVSLTDKAGVPQFVGDAGQLSAKIGQQNVEHFYIKSAAARGDLKITAVHLGDKDKTELKLDPRSSTFTTPSLPSMNGVTISLSCNTADKSIEEIMACRSGACVKSCRVQVTSTCEANEGSTELVISAESTLDAAKAAQDLVYKVNINGKSQSCATVAVAKAAAAESKPATTKAAQGGK